MSAAKRRRIFTLNDPYPLRISGELAAEIGFNESIVLLQLEYLISISTNERDGRLWTYHSLEDLREKFFPWWSRATISRTIKSLRDADLIIVDNFNRAGFDRTQWFALNYDGIGGLESIRVDASISQNEKSMSHSEQSMSQDETPIPETTQKTTDKDLSKDPHATASVTAEERQVIERYAKDYAAELRDEAPLQSSATRMINLYARSGLDLDTFLDVLHRARQVTQKHSGSVRKESGDGSGRKAKVAYLFAVLEDLLEQRGAQATEKGRGLR